MRIILIILGYLGWHYGKAIIALSIIWKNFLNFIFEYFSIKSLFLNFFDPWKRMSDNYPKFFNLKEYFYALITNIIVRGVGIIMRSALIIAGLICYILTALLYPLIIVCWLILPIIIIALISVGILLIIK